MLASTLALSMGLVFLLVARLTGSPASHGVVVFAGIVFVAIGCALQLSAITDAVLAARSSPVRATARLAGWMGIGAGTVWLIGRTPRPEVLLVLLGVPVTLGLAGVVASRHTGRWPAVVFLVTALLLALLLGPIWLSRQAPA